MANQGQHIAMKEGAQTSRTPNISSGGMRKRKGQAWVELLSALQLLCCLVLWAMRFIQTRAVEASYQTPPAWPCCIQARHPQPKFGVVYACRSCVTVMRPHACLCQLLVHAGPRPQQLCIPV
eukprot:scaffold313886_cov23-Tisochrysis_lutea.AAC.1